MTPDAVDWLTFRTHSAARRRHLAQFSRLTRPSFKPFCDVAKKAKHRVDTMATPDLDSAIEDATCDDCIEIAKQFKRTGMLVPPAGEPIPDPRTGERGDDDNGTQSGLFAVPDQEPRRKPRQVRSPARKSPPGPPPPPPPLTVVTDEPGALPADWDQPDPTEPGDDTIALGFQRFHTANPTVYNGLVRLARQARAAGRDRIGIGMLFEVLRWEWITGSLSPDDEAWKLNNNYRSRYARLIMKREPDLTDIFETRSLRSE